MVQVVTGRFWAWSPPASKTMARLTDGAVARRSQREPRVGGSPDAGPPGASWAVLRSG